MKYKIKQKRWTWRDTYLMTDAGGELVYTAEREAVFVNRMDFTDGKGSLAGRWKCRPYPGWSSYELMADGTPIGTLSHKIHLGGPRYALSGKQWVIQGNLMGLHFDVSDAEQKTIAVIDKELFRANSTYDIDVIQPIDALCIMMIVTIIDLETNAADRAASVN